MDGQPNGTGLNLWIHLPRAAADLVAGVWNGRQWKALSSRIETPVEISPDFFGINIATSHDDRYDDYVLEQLEELGIRHVRLDLTPASLGNHAERLLQRVLDAGHPVLLNIFPTLEDARQIGRQGDVDRRWHGFVDTVFQRYGDQDVVFEIGNTPNRRKWSGFNPITYVKAWKIIAPLIETHGVKVAGPNVSDFEPLGNHCILRAINRISQVPSIHTNNLFVERVVEPEANDHRVLGKRARDWLRLNLVKKARVIDHIGRELGCEETYCTYNCWTIRRLKRRSDEPEKKQADYLMRYLVLAATSGALNRVYWGPLVCSRDGLIDCGSQDYPTVDNVAHYQEIRGRLDQLRIRPAFRALQHVCQWLPGSTCVQAVNSQFGVHHFVFITRDQREFHVCWCRDGNQLPLHLLYPPDLGASAKATYYNVMGERLDAPPASVNEQPIMVEFPSPQPRWRPQVQQLASLPETVVPRLSTNGPHYLPFNNCEWRGAVAVHDGHTLDTTLAALLPEALEKADVEKLIRDKRNRVWTIQTDTHGPLTVKLNRAKGGKKLTYRFLDSKGKRQWDNAMAMLSAGILTPRPVAYFERHRKSGTEPNYYVTEFLDNAFSARDVFESINRGDSHCRELPHAYLLEVIGRFVCRMHDAGILHRDLSSGNILFTRKEDVVIPYLIDIGRAKIKARLNHRERLVDVMRICYKLNWEDREKLVSHYADQHGGPIHGWRKAALYFQSKQRSKRRFKGILKGFQRAG